MLGKADRLVSYYQDEEWMLAPDRLVMVAKPL
jgi:hypothetical protein